MAKHLLWKNHELGAPDSILDGNGEVALGLCKLCGAGESELDGPCTGEVTRDRENAARAHHAKAIACIMWHSDPGLRERLKACTGYEKEWASMAVTGYLLDSKWVGDIVAEIMQLGG